MGKWKGAVLNMRALLNKYEPNKITELRSAHKNLVYRVLPQFYKLEPEAEKLFGPYLDDIIDEICAPDRDGDRENGTGRHYYCACSSFGTPQRTVGTYFKNGIIRFAPSARTFMEEDYTMALTMYRAGFVPEAMLYFSRSMHMLQDMCCLPHATRFTYYSPKKKMHRAYEDLAKMMYPDFVPEREIEEKDFHLLDDRRSFARAVNGFVKAVPQEIPLLLTDPEFAITHRLYETEKAVASMFMRFWEDINGKSSYPQLITDGMKFRIMHDLPPLSAKVTKKGIMFTNNGRRCALDLGFGRRAVLFRAAHRGGGRFTFAPLSEVEGRVVSLTTGRLLPFDPGREDIFARIIK